MAIKLMTLFRKRGALLAVISAISALLAAKGTPIGFGYWDGPA